MPTETQLTLTVDRDLQAEFLAEAAATQREATDIIQEFMRDFVQKQREARAYEEFLSQKVERARRSIAAGQFRPHDEVEREFAVRRGS